MTYAEIIAELDTLEASLQDDLDHAQTRGQHITLSQRIGSVQTLTARLRSAMSSLQNGG